MFANVTLDTPIKRGENTVSSVSIRKPSSGELRGLSVTDVMSMEVNALFKLLPRITTPALTVDELMQLDPADLLQMGSEVGNFLLPKKALAQIQ
ncbi:MAG: phage tail assembly protein [Plesiomonas shigelloides]